MTEKLEPAIVTEAVLPLAGDDSWRPRRARASDVHGTARATTIRLSGALVCVCLEDTTIPAKPEGTSNLNDLTVK